jgi:hypothetical protein
MFSSVTVASGTGGALAIALSARMLVGALIM